MNRDLESLVLAFEAWRSASHIEAKKFQDIYEDKIQDVLTRCPGLSSTTLTRLVELQHWRWVVAQSKPSSLPPSV